MKIELRSGGCVASGVVERNVAHTKGLSLPYPRPGKSSRLAVIGGGPSVKSKVDEIKAFNGDVWIIGSAFPWAKSQGIEGVFFCIDPMPESSQDAIGAKQAILASCVDPSMFEVLKDADVSVFDLIESKERMNHGVTTATAVPELAVLLDYTEIIFYGCESSYEGQVHAYDHAMNESESWLLVKCNNEVHKTRPDFFMQAEFLAMVIRKFPSFFKEESGGLLRAWIADPDYDIVGMSEAFHKTLTFKEAA